MAKSFNATMKIKKIDMLGTELALSMEGKAQNGAAIKATITLDDPAVRQAFFEGEVVALTMTAQE